MGQSIQEPSMEDILASIKRIIAEDGEAAPPPPPRVRRGPIAVPDPEPAPESALPPEPDVEQEEPAPEPEPEPAAEVVREEEPAPTLAEDDPDVLELTSPMVAPAGWHAASILSANAEQASRHAFAALAQAPREEAPRERTIEAFMAEMLRPMLSDWLDRELPAIVERIVTTEVRRLSGRG